LTEWNSAESYDTRVSNISTGSGGYTGPLLNCSTVDNDADVDELTGDGDLHWFFATLGQDLTDQESDETLTPI